MKPKIDSRMVVKTLQQAIRDTNDLYLDTYVNRCPTEHSAAMSAITRVTGRFLQALGFAYTSPEHKRFLRRVWSVDRRWKFFEEWMKQENKKQRAKAKGQKPRT